MESLKQVLILAIFLGALIIVGCQNNKSPQEITINREVAVKQVGELPLVYGPPVCLIWYKPDSGNDKWRVYKTISSAEQIFQIINLLGIDMHEMFKGKSLADIPKSQAHAKAFKGDQRLSFIYHRPAREVVATRNMEFNISDGKFIWPAGQSADIYKIFEEQKEWNYQELMDEQYYKRHGYYPGESGSDDTGMPLDESIFMQIK